MSSISNGTHYFPARNLVSYITRLSLSLLSINRCARSQLTGLLQKVWMLQRNPQPRLQLGIQFSWSNTNFPPSFWPVLSHYLPSGSAILHSHSPPTYFSCQSWIPTQKGYVPNIYALCHTPWGIRFTPMPSAIICWAKSQKVSDLIALALQPQNQCPRKKSHGH